MFMGRVGASPESEIVRELNGARILLTGLSASTGVDVARAFADIKARLIVHTTDLSPEMTALIALLSQTASEIKLYTDPIIDADASVRFAQTAAQAYGGLDAVINLATISSTSMNGIASESDAENLISKTLTPLAHLTVVTANRMRVVLSEGMILNVLTMPQLKNGRETAIASYARTALAAMTKSEAHAWAHQGIRINAVGPRVVNGGATLSPGGDGACLTNEPDIAALAIYLASRRGKALSGHIFDCDGVSARGC
jgi:3-oxoacyl-[acyl-carrier protein] reductase